MAAFLSDGLKSAFGSLAKHHSRFKSLFLNNQSFLNPLKVKNVKRIMWTRSVGGTSLQLRCCCIIPQLHHRISPESENRVLAHKSHLWCLFFPCIKCMAHEKSMHIEIKEFLLFSQDIQRWEQHQCHPSFSTVAAGLPSLSAQLLHHSKQRIHDHGDKNPTTYLPYLPKKPSSTPHKE